MSVSFCLLLKEWHFFFFESISILRRLVTAGSLSTLLTSLVFYTSALTVSASSILIYLIDFLSKEQLSRPGDKALSTIYSLLFYLHRIHWMPTSVPSNYPGFFVTKMPHRLALLGAWARGPGLLLCWNELLFWEKRSRSCWSNSWSFSNKS